MNARSNITAPVVPATVVADHDTARIVHLYRRMEPDKQKAFAHLVEAIHGEFDPSDEIVSLVGAERGADLIACWRECMAGRAA